MEKDRAEILDHSFVKVSEKTIMKEIQMVRILRPDLKKYFYHTSINFPPGEDVSNEMMKQIGLDYLAANGFDQHQYIMFRHNDADHPHIHILVNRIGYDGKVVSDSNDYARSEKVLRELEKKYNLTQVISSREAKERGMSKNELEMILRKNTPSHKMAMQTIIGEVLKSKGKMSINEFISNLQARGVQVLFNQASTGYVSGISYSYQGMVMQGSKLGNGFKWSTIKTLSTMNKKEIAQQFTKQTLDPNQPSINVGQVTDMLRKIEQLHSKVLCNTEGFRIQQRLLEAGFIGLRSRFQDLDKPIAQMEERLRVSSNKLAKDQRSSLWQRYWTAAVVGIMSALLTNLLWKMGGL